MAFREVTMLEIKEVLRRWLRGETKSEISRQCGVSRGTARSYIRVAQEGGLSPGQSDSVLDDDEWLACFGLTASPRDSKLIASGVRGERAGKGSRQAEFATAACVDDLVGGGQARQQPGGQHR